MHFVSHYLHFDVCLSVNMYTAMSTLTSVTTPMHRYRITNASTSTSANTYRKLYQYTDMEVDIYTYVYVHSDGNRVCWYMCMFRLGYLKCAYT
jgi:hypothetical protein